MRSWDSEEKLLDKLNVYLVPKEIVSTVDSHSIYSVLPNFSAGVWMWM